MLITETYKTDILGQIACYDRVIINGVNGAWGYAKGMTSFFYGMQYKIFDFAKIFEAVTDEIIENAEQLAKENNIEIEYIRKSGVFRKDDRIEEILKKRGYHEGLVHIFSALELCATYDPWHDKKTGQTYFKFAQTKRKVYYFYFIDKLLGLCFLRVPSVAPFQVMFYFNGHNLLESKFKKANIQYEKRDNAFVFINDFKKAQELSDNIKVEDIHSALDAFQKRFCPLPEKWQPKFNWTIHQVEYSLDMVFRDACALKPLYDNIIKTAMHTVTPENISSFLGKRFSIQYEGEIGSKYNQRILGTRIKHQMGETSVKVYDKFGSVLRIEVTSNDVSKMKVFREVNHKDGTVTNQWANCAKSIYSLYILTKTFRAVVNRYLEFVSSFDDPSDGIKKLDKATEDVEVNGRKYKGFNFFSKVEQQILLTVVDGKFSIKGMTSKLLRDALGKTKSQIARILQRLRFHGLIKKAGKTHRYYVTAVGRQIFTAAFKSINMELVTSLAIK